jgi:hypothetical protein
VADQGGKMIHFQNNPFIIGGHDNDEVFIAWKTALSQNRSTTYTLILGLDS